MASINPTSHPLRARTGNGNDSLNNSRVINRFAVVGNATKNVNSERERLGALAAPVAQTASTNYLDNDEEEQDTVSDRGKVVNAICIKSLLCEILFLWIFIRAELCFTFTT